MSGDEEKMEVIPTKIVKMIRNMVDGDKNPNTFRYLLSFGLDAAIPELEVNMMGLTKEQIYGYCIENNCRWEDVLDRLPPDVLT